MPSSVVSGVAPETVRLQWGVKIPLRDGVQLNATVYLPANQATPAPAIFTLTPYIAQTYHERGMYFAAHGYPFLTIDVRGRGNSQGEFRPLINEAQDGFDIVEWLAEQSYCNGKVAMWGGSYGGYDQWATAKEFPPHLATIAPVAAPVAGYDFPLRFNILLPYLMQWLTLVWGKTGQEKLFWNNERFWAERFRAWADSGKAYRELDTFMGSASAIFQEWAAHPQQGDYWDEYNPTTQQYAALSLPILTITGTYDANQAGALRHYREHLKSAPASSSARHYLVIGPWDHDGTRTPAAEFCGVKVGPESLVDLPDLHRQWYAWTMQDGSKPAFLRDKVAYYVMGAERWRYAASLKAVTARHEALYLNSSSNPTDVFHSGWLGAQLPDQTQPDQYFYDPLDTSLATLEATIHPDNCVDHRMVHASIGRQLVYHSAPLTQDTELSGFFKLLAWFSIDQPDADFSVSVYEIGLDGGAIRLTADWLKARYRENPRDPKLIRTLEPLRYEFQGFNFVSRQIKKGHRLRLVVGPLQSIHAQRNFNSGKPVAEETRSDARPVKVRLYHDAQHPSALYVPFGQSEG